MLSALREPFVEHVGVSEIRGPEYGTLNSRIKEADSSMYKLA